VVCPLGDGVDQVVDGGEAGAPGGKQVKRKAWLWLGLALVVAGAGTLIVGVSAGGRAPDHVDGVVPVDSGARNPLDIQSHNSPSVARNPTKAGNVVVSARIDAPAFACSLSASFDGGKHWIDSPIPQPVGEEPKCYAPDLAFGVDGVLHVTFVTLAGNGNVPHAGWIVSSGDGGRTLSTPRQILGPLAFQIRLGADPAIAGRLYVTWLQARGVGTLAFAEDDNPVDVMRSDDGGVTWTGPVRVNPTVNSQSLAPTVVAGADGRVWVGFLSLGDDALDYHGGHQGRGGPPYAGRWQLVVSRSTDAGASWRESVVDAGIVPTQRFIAFIPPFPAVAADRSGTHVYTAFQDGRLGDADVRLWASGDGGASWDAGRRVNDTPVNDATSQYLPSLAVAANGRLDVMYLDRRADRDDVMNEVSIQSSFDRGSSFRSHTRVSDRPFDSRIGFGSAQGMADLGSRLGLVSFDSGALAVWPDTREGTQASNKQNLASTLVQIHGGGRLGAWAGVVTMLGVVILTAAAALILGLMMASPDSTGFPRPRLTRTGGSAP
jgi:hypothetical protein